jgi:hypothetical protein
MDKTAYVQCGLRLPAELKAWVDSTAKKDKRSFNNFIETTLSKLKDVEEKRNEQKAA